MLRDYRILYRCFKGPGYWGHFKNIKAFDPEHANRKMERVRAGCERNHGVTGEFRIVPVTTAGGRGESVLRFQVVVTVPKKP